MLNQFKKNILLLPLLLFCLVMNFQLPSFAQAICSGSSVVCTNGATADCPSGSGLDCGCGIPQCFNRQTYSDLINSGFGSQVCNPVFNPPSSPICFIPTPVSTPTPPPTITYSCDSGYTSCPDNMTEGVCCLFGCCPSNPFLCKCLGNNQCFPNCNLATPTPTPTINSSSNNPSPTPIQSTGNETITISRVGEIKRNGFILEVELFNLSVPTSCKVSSKWNGRNLIAVPSSFQVTLNSSRSIQTSFNYSNIIRINIPNNIYKKIKNSNLKNIQTKITCPSIMISAVDVQTYE
jgi:hypothetical protein